MILLWSKLGAEEGVTVGKVNVLTPGAERHCSLWKNTYIYRTKILTVVKLNISSAYIWYASESSIKMKK